MISKIYREFDDDIRKLLLDGRNEMSGEDFNLMRFPSDLTTGIMTEVAKDVPVRKRRKELCPDEDGKSSYFFRRNEKAQNGN
jgi:hypothetical protein